MVTGKTSHGNSEGLELTYFITGYIFLEGTKIV